ncbi:MAG: PQQ-binding-like beta-propeller repeat protein [Planctomycetia bacterium]|jgi:outer membrane protein assembly factor BamB
MRTTTLLCLTLAVLLLNMAADWPQFRGPTSNAVAPDADRVPDDLFDMKTGEGIAWKVDLPGEGASTPIVIGKKIIVTSSDGLKKDRDQDRLYISAYDVDSGKLLWQRRFQPTGYTTIHPLGSIANATPATDGKYLVAVFSSNDVVCLDLDGNLLWHRGLTYEHPQARHDTGMACSPLLIDGAAVIQVENQGDSFIEAINLADGKTRWHIPGKKKTVWTTPNRLPQEDGKDLILLQSSKQLAALDPATGKAVWKHEIDCNTVASTVVQDGLIYLPARGLNALKPVGASEGEEPVETVWSQKKMRSYASSPIVHEGRAYVLKPPSILVCADVKTGKVLWQVRLKGKTWASPVLAGDRIFTANQDGLIQAIDISGKKGKVVAKAEYGEVVLGSPIVVDGALFLRGERTLTKVSKE